MQNAKTRIDMERIFSLMFLCVKMALNRSQWNWNC